MWRAYFIVILLACSGICCNKDSEIQAPPEPVDITETGYQTENVIIVVIDGPRYTETWGEVNHSYIPRLSNDLAPQGVVNTNFRNNGGTYTSAGYTALCTGFYQVINNSGLELPYNPSLFQRWQAKTNAAEHGAWIVTSKDKLQVMADCVDADWAGQFIPFDNCGLAGNGVGAGYREDEVTLNLALQVLQEDQPTFMMIGFKEPDATGHQGDWGKYLEEITITDEYTWRIWDYLQNDPYYAGKTTFVLTNDHGRHTDGVLNGFASHGDDCIGCRHILLFAAGPDFKKNAVINQHREITDIAATIAELLGFEIPNSQGAVMTELFR